MTSSRSLILVISSMRGGGAERVMSILANHWAAHGWIVHLVTLTQESLQDDAYALHPNVRRIFIQEPASAHSSRFRRFLINRFRIGELRALAREVKPAAVLSFMTAANVLAILAFVPLGIRTVVSERTNPKYFSELGRAWALARLLVYRRAHKVVLQTQPIERWFHQRWIRNTAVIANPLTKPVLQDVPRSSVIVAAGRLSHEKGFDLLLAAFARLADRFPAWSLVILGEGSERSRLQALAAQLRLGDRFSLPGFVPNLAQRFAGAGLVVQPSRFEGMPNVVLEAMATGAAVISTDNAAGCVITNGTDGLLVPVDDVTALAECMEKLMAADGARYRLGQAAALSVEKYAVPHIASKWEAVLQLNGIGPTHHAP